MIADRDIEGEFPAVRIQSTHPGRSFPRLEPDQVMIGPLLNGITIHCIDPEAEESAMALLSYDDVREIITELQALLPVAQ